jgi:hypothetical protein
MDESAAAAQERGVKPALALADLEVRLQVAVQREGDVSRGEEAGEGRGAGGGEPG